MKPTKNLISLVRVLVKPEYQKSVLNDCVLAAGTLRFLPLSANETIHGLPVILEIVPYCFEDVYKLDDWNEYPKFKPHEEGFYFIRYNTGAEYIRKWVNGDWHDLTGGTRSHVCSKKGVKFKWYKKEL